MNRIINSSQLTIIGFIVLLILSLQPFLLVPMEKELAYHMIIEHSIFFLLGASSVKVAEILLRHTTMNLRKQNKIYTESQTKNKNLSLSIVSIWSKLLRKIFVTKKIGLIWLAITIFLLGIWHVPAIFDYSELHDNIHVLQHISFIFVGVTGFLTIRSFGESYIIFLILIMAGMMSFLGLLFSVTDTPIFNVYTVNSHSYAGIYMLGVGVVFLLVGLPIYMIKKTILYTKTKM